MSLLVKEHCSGNQWHRCKPQCSFIRLGAKSPAESYFWFLSFFLRGNLSDLYRTHLLHQVSTLTAALLLILHSR